MVGTAHRERENQDNGRWWQYFQEPGRCGVPEVTSEGHLFLMLCSGHPSTGFIFPGKP